MVAGVKKNEDDAQRRLAPTIGSDMDGTNTLSFSDTLSSSLFVVFFSRAKIPSRKKTSEKSVFVTPTSSGSDQYV